MKANGGPEKGGPEVVVLELEKLPGSGLGFNVVGGNDQEHIPGDPGIFVSRIRREGAAYTDGRLREGDRIVSVNGHWVGDVPHNDAVGLLRAASGIVRLETEPQAEKTALSRTEPEAFSPSSSRDSVKTVIDASAPKGDTVDTPKSGVSMAGSLASLASSGPQSNNRQTDTAQPTPDNTSLAFKDSLASSLPPRSNSSAAEEETEETELSGHWREAGFFLVGLAAISLAGFFVYRRLARK